MATNDDDRDAKMMRDEHKALNTGGKASPMGPHQTLKFLVWTTVKDHHPDNGTVPFQA